MFFSAPLLLSFVASALAYSVTQPSTSQPWTASGPQTVSWTSVSTDPATFAIVLSNLGGQYEQVLVAQVNKDEGGGSISVYPPSGGWPQGSDFRINFVPDVNHPDQILAQSGQYNIGDASSSALSNLPHTTVTSPVASVSTGSAVVTSSPATVSTTAVTNTVSTTSLRAASATLTSTTAEVTPTSLNAGSKATIHVGLIPFLLALPFFA